MTTATPTRSGLRAAIWGAVATLVSFAAVLTGTIILVSRLSSLERITLAGGIAVFAIALGAWIVAATWGWVRWARRH
jgi:hypothetical protein